MSMNAGACMKPDFGFLPFGVLAAPRRPVLIVLTGMPWDFMEINGNVWPKLQDTRSGHHEKQDAVGSLDQN
jgi:hypothetical protein